MPVACWSQRSCSAQIRCASAALAVVARTGTSSSLRVFCFFALRTGAATWVGNPREALIVLPGPLRERYELSRR